MAEDKDAEAKKKELKEFLKALKGEEQEVVFISIGSLTLPLNSIQTIKKKDEYNYDLHTNDYFVVINETTHNNASPLCNVRVKFDDWDEREDAVDNVFAQMAEHDVKFV